MREILFVIALTGCISATPYQDATTAKEMGPNRWIISVRGNGKVRSDTILEYTHRKAQELCPDGYDILDQSGGRETVGHQKIGDQTYDRHRANAATMIECKQ